MLSNQRSMLPKLLYGPNEFLRQQALQQIKQTFLQTETDLNLTILAASPTCGEIMSASQTPPLFGVRRLIIIRDFDFKSATLDLEKFLLTVPDFCELVFEKAVVDGRTRFFKFWQKNFPLQEFKNLRPQEFARWLRAEVQQRQLNCEPAALHLFTIFTQGDLATASQELTKLAIFAQGARITVADVKALTHADLHANIFELTDALCQRQAPQALAILQDLLQRGESIWQIFAMLVRQFRILLLLTDLQRKHLNRQELIQQTKLHPFVLQKTLPQLRNFTLTELLQAHQALLRIEQAAKTGGISSTGIMNELQFALEKFILQFSSSRVT